MSSEIQSLHVTQFFKIHKALTKFLTNVVPEKI